MSWSIRSNAIPFIAALITSPHWLGAQASAPKQAASSACSLLTKEDAAAALGEAVTGPKALADMPGGQGATVSSCEYAGSGIHELTLNLTRLPPSSVSMYRQSCSKASKDGLAGLGELACWYNEKHAELHAFKGTAFVSIELRRSGDPTEAIKALMKKAVDRLK